MNRDKLDFGTMKIGPLFRALFFPTLIGMIFTSLITVIDGMFVGHGVGAAVNGLPLFAICSIFFAVNVTFIGYYQSLEKSGISIFYTLLRGIIILVPTFIFLPSIIGATGLADWLPGESIGEYID